MAKIEVKEVLKSMDQLIALLTLFKGEMQRLDEELKKLGK